MSKVLLLGSGALKIGEAGEFDYSGSQAIKALKEEGVRVILVNPNIATVQTSEGLANEVYFVPVTYDFVERVIAKEKPDGILLSFGGQTALNCGLDLHARGILEKYAVSVLGTPIAAIIATEDREVFGQKLSSLGIATAKGHTVGSVAQALDVASRIGYPVMVRAGFALGGAGSGIAKNAKSLEALVEKSLSTTQQIIVEESLAGWKEVEYEVVRDKNDNCITVCNMENFDPVGIHTGESIVVAPSQTLNNEEYYGLRQKSIDVIRSLGVVGECNIQFALHPTNGDIRVIEVNARLSRSSALASKATGFPLAYVAAKLALGKTLPELPNLITKKTTAFFEPALDYVVVKIPRWDLDKFTHVEEYIGSEMKSVGEVMSIARTFEEAIQKAARMLNDGYNGVIDRQYSNDAREVLLKKLTIPNTLRLFTICSAIRAGISIETIHKITGIDPWFLAKLAHIASMYHEMTHAKSLTKTLLIRAKKLGFGDRQIADIRGISEKKVRHIRQRNHIFPFTLQIDTMAGEFPAKTNYLYCTYNAQVSDQILPSKKKRVMVLGCGPYAIGTSVEFDWCAVNTIQALREKNIETVVVNCNPETVSTDFDISDRLYFEELTLERVLDIFRNEKAPCIVSVGGQISNNLSFPLHDAGVPILGTSGKNIFRAENRQSFSKLLDVLGIAQPPWAEVGDQSGAVKSAARIGFPILVRPSFVLSGKAMSVIYSEEELVNYLRYHKVDISGHSFVLTKFLAGAREFDFDGVAEGGHTLVCALSEHVESGGVHSGDSTLILPSPTASRALKQQITNEAARIVSSLSVTGPFNIQFLVSDGVPYVIECNLRASRSLPFVSKVKHINFIKIATDALVHEKNISIPSSKNGFFAVKVPQFSFRKLRGADPVTRVEMSSTGEVAAFGQDPYEAYLKALLATGIHYPSKKTALISLGGAEAKMQLLSGCAKLQKLNFTIFATVGTHMFLKEYGIASQRVEKIHDKLSPNVYDLLQSGYFDFLIVIPKVQDEHSVKQQAQSVTDGYIMRRIAIDLGIPLFSNTDSANYFIETIARYTQESVRVAPWKTYIQYHEGGKQ